MERARQPVRIAPLAAAHRGRVEQILRATSVFREVEVVVALELFDVVYADADPADGTPHPDYAFVGAFDEGGGLVGYACYGPTPDTDRTYDLYWIVVDPAAQGTGVGTCLLAEVERRLAAASARLLVIETSSRPEYAATRAFYQARAYTEAARVGSFYAPDDDRVIYTKRVQAAPVAGLGAAAP